MAARRNSLGEIRRSQVITVHGPGSIVDFRSGFGGGAAVSAVPAGLEVWDEGLATPGLSHPQVIHEPRLEARLGVKGFRLPPVIPQERPNVRKITGEELKAVRFPQWMQCPVCHHLKPASRWGETPGDPALKCGTCSATEGRTIHVVPSRFVMACRNGHLEDFPWNAWVGHHDGCERKRPLKLQSRGGGGLGALVVTCKDCGASRPMEGVFGKDALRNLGVKCHGRRPWLTKHDDKCDETPRALQRGASNLYFPVLESALDIPPWSDRVQKLLHKYWGLLTSSPSAEGRRAILDAAHKESTHLGEMDFDQLVEMVETRIRLIEETTKGDLRYEEYLQLAREGGAGVGAEASSEFEIRRNDAPPEVRPWIRIIGQATRIREVRALRAFTRITPASGSEDEDAPRLAPLSVKPMDWLPAIEVRGEGLFLEFDPRRIAKWEKQPAVRARAEVMDDAYKIDWVSRHGKGSTPPDKVVPRLLLVHSFAHALIRQLSLECGYSSASLRERLYVAEGDDAMAGALIYTATSDSDGTLGGLVRQGEPGRIVETIQQALRSQQWCSSDPLCISGVLNRSQPLNEAACHSCLLAAETSCERFNRLLDRGMLVGWPEEPGAGFFSDLLDSPEWLT